MTPQVMRNSLPARLEAVHPVLMSGDVSASVAFFRRLGFEVTFQDRAVGPSYAAVTRDAVTLHVQWHADARSAPERDRPVYRFLCPEVDLLWTAFRSAGATHAGDPAGGPFAEPSDTPWGTREFHLRDPDGNGLQFYRPL